MVDCDHKNFLGYILPFSSLLNYWLLCCFVYKFHGLPHVPSWSFPRNLFLAMKGAEDSGYSPYQVIQCLI
jgi:hypothetical protein